LVWFFCFGRAPSDATSDEIDRQLLAGMKERDRRALKRMVDSGEITLDELLAKASLDDDDEDEEDAEGEVVLEDVEAYKREHLAERKEEEDTAEKLHGEEDDDYDHDQGDDDPDECNDAASEQ
jgi:hypothetical protein